MTDLNHWDLTFDKQSIAWLGFDRKEAAVNTVNDEVLDELNQVLDTLSSNKKCIGLIIYSLKEKGFIAGADVTHFSTFKDSKVAHAFLRKGQTVFDKLAAMAIPTVAMINGFCMGGGCELALACDHRVMTDCDDARIGLPEIMLGIHPGWGGTIRLPLLIGGFNALSKMILTGRSLRGKQAKRLGLIDACVALRQLRRAAIHFIEAKPAKHQPKWHESLTNSSLLRPLVAKLIRKQLQKHANQSHYPAPYAVVDNWEKEPLTSAKAQLVEADSIASLITKNETTNNLLRAFSLRERMKSFAKTSDFQAKQIHVIGAGTMGGDIAAWCALRGLNVTLQDREYKYISPAISRAYKLFKKKLKKPRLVQAAMDRLTPDLNGAGIKQADVIIEAIYENLGAKQALFKTLEQQASAHAILASNTSSIPLDEISSVMSSPERLIGIHFFNPVSKMELVEVVASQQSAKTVLNDAYSFVGQIGRLPLPVKSSPGFLVNRVLMPYLMECVALLDEGYSGEAIDQAAKGFGMMMGPVELADTVGLDVCLAVAENLTSHFGGEISNRLKEMVAKGELGKKSGKGFYSYKKGKPQKKAVDNEKNDVIADRLILRMINEAAACLREGVVEDSDLLDAGMIFGTGFAPFRGGPMQYANSYGDDKLNHLFSELEQKFGQRFKADEGLSH